MARFLIDTDVLIDHLRGYPQAKLYLGEKHKEGDTLYCSVITRAELFSGLRPGEEDKVRAVLNNLEEVPIDHVIAEKAGNYRREFGKSHNLLLPDALIAAVAKVKDAALVTLNIKHFPMEDISILAPYEKE